VPPGESDIRELRRDIKDSLTEVKNAIHDLREELRSDYVGRGEYISEIASLRRELTQNKEQSRWTSSQIVVVLGAALTSGVSLINIFYR
jgi:predicted nuclease with TOPRIM domain